MRYILPIVFILFWNTFHTQDKPRMADKISYQLRLPLSKILVIGPQLGLEYFKGNNSIYFDIGTGIYENHLYSIFEPTTKYSFYSSDLVVSPSYIEFKDFFSFSFTGSIGYKRYFNLKSENFTLFAGLEAVTSGGKYHSDTTDQGTFGSFQSFNGYGNSADENKFVLNQRRQNDFLLRLGVAYLFKIIYAEASVDMVSSHRKFDYYGLNPNGLNYEKMSTNKSAIVPSFTITAGFNFSYFSIKRKKNQARSN